MKKDLAGFAEELFRDIDLKLLKKKRSECFFVNANLTGEH
jgi:hypothetical protein